MAPETQEIEILSIGTASPPTGKTIDKEDVSWGIMPQEWMFGVGIAETAMDAQASGAGFMAGHIIPHLKHKVKLLRLPHTPPSADQTNHVGIDKTYPKALKAMMDMGISDAETIHGKCMSSNPGDLAVLKSIFEEMLPFQEAEKAAA